MDNTIATVSELTKIKEGFEGQVACILPQSKRKFCSIHPFCRKLYITDIGYYPHATFHNRERKQGCHQFVLIYCVKGQGWYSVKNKKFTVKQNQYFILPKGISHEYGAELKNPWSIYWVHFTGENAAYLADYLQPKNNGPVLVAPSALRLMVFEDILGHLELLNNNSNLIYANSSLYAFLVSFQRLHLKTSNKEENPIEEVIAYMKANLDKNLTLEDLAVHVHMSPSHLSALFRQKTKYSPINLFTSLKIQKASQLLLDEQYNIKTIAASLGYDDPYHFSRVFRNTMGISPKYFKKE
jgi:AraC family transcriptional regulator, arabinose operon regulatory protein